MSFEKFETMTFFFNITYLINGLLLCYKIIIDGKNISLKKKRKLNLAYKVTLIGNTVVKVLLEKSLGFKIQGSLHNLIPIKLWPKHYVYTSVGLMG